MSISPQNVIPMVRDNLGDQVTVAGFPDVALKGDVLLAEVQAVTNDTVSAYRVPTATQLMYANDGQRAILAMLPWLLWTVAGTAGTYADASGLTSSDTLYIPQRLKGALVAYMAMRCYQQAGSDTFNETSAKEQKALFDTAIASTPFRVPNNVLLADLNAILRQVTNDRPHVMRAADASWLTFSYVAISGDTVPSTAFCVTGSYSLPDECLLTLVAGTTMLAYRRDPLRPTSQAHVKFYTAEYERLKQEL